MYTVKKMYVLGSGEKDAANGMPHSMPLITYLMGKSDVHCIAKSTDVGAGKSSCAHTAQVRTKGVIQI